MKKFSEYRQSPNPLFAAGGWFIPATIAFLGYWLFSYFNNNLEIIAFLTGIAKLSLAICVANFSLGALFGGRRYF